MEVTACAWVGCDRPARPYMFGWRCAEHVPEPYRAKYPTPTTTAEAEAPWPAPEVRARAASATEVPTGAKRVRSAAEAAGWTVAATYARGTGTAGRDHHRALVDSIALRMRSTFNPSLRAVAVWERIDEDDANGKARAWKHDMAYVWEIGKLNPYRIGLDRLRDIINGASHLKTETEDDNGNVS